MDDEAVKSRLIGLLLICVGIILAYWNHSMRVTSGSYYLQLAFLAPLLITFGINLVIEAPQIPVNKPSLFGWLCIFAGFGIGFWNALF